MTNKLPVSGIRTASRYLLNPWLTRQGLFTLLVFILTFSISSVAFADVYKWVDENGQVHYGAHPGNTAAESVTIRNNETTKPRSLKTKDDDKTSSDGKTEQQAAQPEVVEEVKIPKKEKRRLCNEAKSDVASISSRGRMREINAKGEYIYLSEKQRQQRLSAARKKQREYCR